MGSVREFGGMQGEFGQEQHGQVDRRVLRRAGKPVYRSPERAWEFRTSTLSSRLPIRSNLHRSARPQGVTSHALGLRREWRRTPDALGNVSLPLSRSVAYCLGRTRSRQDARRGRTRSKRNVSRTVQSTLPASQAVRPAFILFHDKKSMVRQES